MKNFFFTFAIISLATTNALAIDATPPANATQTSAASGMDSLAPAAGNYKGPKVNYDALSRAEKIKYINERHDANVKKAIAKWKGMNDDQKIAQYEKRRNNFAARRTGKTHQSAAAAANATAPAAGTAPAPIVDVIK